MDRKCIEYLLAQTANMANGYHGFDFYAQDAEVENEVIDDGVINAVIYFRKEGFKPCYILTDDYQAAALEKGLTGIAIVGVYNPDSHRDLKYDVFPVRFVNGEEVDMVTKEPKKKGGK